MTVEVTRRELNFQTLSDIISDAETLLSNGYEQAGNWNLAQVAGHVAEWMRYPMDGFPKPAFPINLMLWLAKVSVGKRQLEKVFNTGEMPAGGPTLKSTVPGEDCIVDSSLDKLRDAVIRLEQFDGIPHASPLFGALSKEQVVKLNLIHAAHHFSFLVPKR